MTYSSCSCYSSQIIFIKLSMCAIIIPYSIFITLLCPSSSTVSSYGVSPQLISKEYAFNRLPSPLFWTTISVFYAIFTNTDIIIILFINFLLIKINAKFWLFLNINRILYNINVIVSYFEFCRIYCLIYFLEMFYEFCYSKK